MATAGRRGGSRVEMLLWLKVDFNAEGAEATEKKQKKEN
jgi:hypothetical protein